MKKIFFVCILLTTFVSYSQVGIGTTTPVDAAMLEVSGQTASGDYKGFMPPRVLTDTDRDAINPLAVDAGLLVFVTGTGCLNIWNGTAWEDIHCNSGTEIWINEFHYSNIGTDTGEFIELAGTAGTNLDGYRIIGYNGATGGQYNTLTFPLGTTIPDQSMGIGTVSLAVAAVPGLQNGLDGLALIDPSDNLIQFLSYEGSFTAIDGLAIGVTSIGIRAAEGENSPVGSSVYLSGAGSAYADFTWTGTTANTSGNLNRGQTIN